MTSPSAAERARGATDRAVEPSDELRFLALLGLPAFGLALASTVVSTYLPVIIERLSGPAVTGLLIGGEGIVGIFLPSLVGAWSDRTDTRLGSRMPFILGATALAVASLLTLPILGSLLAIAVALLVFWVSYFAYYTPYWALYPDLVSADVRGRAMGLQGAWRSVGLLAAMVGGGVLLGIWQPLPFVVAAAGLVAITAVVFVLIGGEARSTSAQSSQGFESLSEAWRLVRQHADLRRFLVANTLWEFTVAALKTFVVLFFTVGLGRSLGFTTVVLATVAGAAILAAPASGWVGDRFGRLGVMEAALWVFAFGLLLPFLTLSNWAFAGIFLVAFAAVAVMTLPYSVLMDLMPGEDHGVAAGLFGFSRGAGTLLGPLVTGIAVELLDGVPFFARTEGYIALFGITSLALLLSIPFLRSVRGTTS